LLPVLNHSSQPRALGVNLRIVPRCEQLIFMVITHLYCASTSTPPWLTELVACLYPDCTSSSRCLLVVLSLKAWRCRQMAADRIDTPTPKSPTIWISRRSRLEGTLPGLKRLFRRSTIDSERICRPHGSRPDRSILLGSGERRDAVTPSFQIRCRRRVSPILCAGIKERP
jgi:hypothetical protein